MVTALFNKILGENEKCVFYFYFKTEGTFYNPILLTIKNYWIISAFLCHLSALNQSQHQTRLSTDFFSHYLKYLDFRIFIFQLDI